MEDLPPLGDSFECRLNLAFYLKAPTARTCGCRRLNNITSKLLKPNIPVQPAVENKKMFLIMYREV
jgi:hypothetical protein